MATPVPDLPAISELSPAFSFGGYAAQAEELQGVGFWPRAAARFIDLITHSLVALCTYFLFGILLAIAAGLAGQPVSELIDKLDHNRIVDFVFALLGSIAYETLCEGLHGSTLGKLALSMVVVREDGSPCRLRPALVRALGYFVDTLFFGLIGYVAMQRTGPLPARPGARLHCGFGSDHRGPGDRDRRLIGSGLGRTQREQRDFRRYTQPHRHGEGPQASVDIECSGLRVAAVS